MLPLFYFYYIDAGMLSNRKLKGFIAILTALVFFERLITLRQFAFIYTDGDQLVLWLAAKDILNGIFHGFCFYGQKYNPLFEPLFSIPLLWAGLNPEKALPIVTSALSILPFIFIAIHLFKKYRSEVSLIPLIVLLLLPVDYLLITSMPRGFVAGVFFCVIGLLFSEKPAPVFKALAGFLLGISLFANPNAFLLFPLLIPVIFRKDEKTWQNIFYLTAGFIAGCVPAIINNIFYNTHPQLVLHRSPDLSFSRSIFLSVINKLDNYFNAVTPVLWRGGWLSLLFFIPAAYIFYRRKEKAKFIATLAIFGLIIFSFCVKKVEDGTNSIFLSGARMFIAYPVILTYFFIWLYMGMRPELKTALIKTFLALAVVAFFVKAIFFHSFLNESLSPAKVSVVKFIKVSHLKSVCFKMMNFTSKKPGLVMATSLVGQDQLINYGCPCMYDSFPNTFMPMYERRYWVKEKVINKAFNPVLLYGSDMEQWDKINIDDYKVIKHDTAYNWLLIENKETTAELLKKLKL